MAWPPIPATYCPVATLLAIVPAILAIAFTTLLERKLMAAAQLRIGPNLLGLTGLLQPIADGVKLLSKELILPHSSYGAIFMTAPIVLLLLSLGLWIVIPWGCGAMVASTTWSLLLLLIVSTCSIHAIALTGWSAQANYSLLGALRSTAQLVSYELVFATLALIVMASTQSTNIQALPWLQDQQTLAWPLLLTLPLYGICVLAESNRAPFDLPEAEAELVAGFNVEHSGISFAFLFLAEYNNMLLLTALATQWYFSTSSLLPYLEPLSLWWAPIVAACKMSMLLSGMILVRAAYPRYRYDQLLMLGWKALLPLLFGLLGVTLILVP